MTREADLAVIESPTFKAALEGMASLDQVSFAPNPDRWAVREPKLQIINRGTHLDREHFGNYHIRRAGELIGIVYDFPRGHTLSLIEKALEIATRCEDLTP